MKSAIFALALMGLSLRVAPQIYICRNARISFFSSAPIEDIQAVSNNAVSALNIVSRAIFFKVEIRSFEFRKSLMQEHFNEDYLESDKYPYAQFKGSILGNIDLSKNGTFQAPVQGELTIHNITRSYTTQGTFVVSAGKITAHAVFPVKLVDHKIKVPRILTEDIAQTVSVTVDATYDPDTSGSN